MNRRLATGLMLSMLLVSSVRADDYQVVYREGLVAYRAGDYDGAFAKFGAAFKESLSAKILIDMGLCRLKAGDGASALYYFEWYLRKDKDVSPIVRADIDLYIAQAEQMKAEVRRQYEQKPATDSDVPIPSETIYLPPSCSVPEPETIPLEPVEMVLYLPRSLHLRSIRGDVMQSLCGGRRNVLSIWCADCAGLAYWAHYRR